MKTGKGGKVKHNHDLKSIFLYGIFALLLMVVFYLILGFFSYRYKFACDYMGRYWVEKGSEISQHAKNECLLYDEYFTRYAKKDLLDAGINIVDTKKN